MQKSTLASLSPLLSFVRPYRLTRRSAFDWRVSDDAGRALSV
jgi:hypothetical protein